MKNQVIVSSDVRGITLEIPQGMTGRKLAAFREANKVALQAARDAAAAGEPVAMVIECAPCEVAVTASNEASEQSDEGDTIARQRVPQIDVIPYFTPPPPPPK